MSDNESSWRLNLDTEDATAAADTLKKGLTGIGATDFSELVTKITEIGSVVGVVGAAIAVLAESIHLVMDAEEIKAVNQQFQLLAHNAGLFGDNLKEALSTSSGGLVDETTLLKGAGEALVLLGDNAAKLPEIMELARKATAVFGGDLMQNFRGITEAIATGNTRMLKHMGIVVDNQKAYEDYAKSIGVAVDELSESGKQHAMLNAVLEKSQTAFQGVDVNLKQTTNMWLQFKTAMKEVADGVALAFDKMFGKDVQNMMTMFANGAHSISNWFKASFGAPADAAAAKLDTLKGKLADLQAQQKFLQEQKNAGKLFDDTSLERTNKAIAEITAQMQKQSVVAKQLGDEEKKRNEQELADLPKAVKESEVNTKKREEDQRKFYATLEALREKNAQEEAKSATSIEQVDKAAADKRLAILNQFELKKKELAKRFDIDPKQKAQMEEQLERQKNLQLEQIDADLYNQRVKALDNLESKNTTTVQKVSNVWSAESKKAALELSDFTKLAQSGFSAVSDNATSMFEALGNGSKTAGDAMKGFLFGALGDIAEAAGKVMIAEGIWPPNPIALAGGGALIALGSFLKSQANGGGTSIPSSGASSGGGASSSGSGTTSTPSNNSASAGPATSSNPQKSVSFIVQGNLYSSNEAKLEMMSIMRAATDATDYKYTQVGGG